MDRVLQVVEKPWLNWCESGYRRQMPGMLESVHDVFPEAKYQRCTVHFYRNVFSVVPRSKIKIVAKMLKAIHAQENKSAAKEKAKQVAQSLREMKLKEAATKIENSIDETLTYTDFPSSIGRESEQKM